MQTNMQLQFSLKLSNLYLTGLITDASKKEKSTTEKGMQFQKEELLVHWNVRVSPRLPTHAGKIMRRANNRSS